MIVMPLIIADSHYLLVKIIIFTKLNNLKFIPGKFSIPNFHKVQLRTCLPINNITLSCLSVLDVLVDNALTYTLSTIQR